MCIGRVAARIAMLTTRIRSFASASSQSTVSTKSVFAPQQTTRTPSSLRCFLRSECNRTPDIDPENAAQIIIGVVDTHQSSITFDIAIDHNRLKGK